MYSSYTAAIFPRKLDLAEKYGVNLEGALTWAFEFEGQPYFAGFRTLATRGIDKPVLNVFRMFSRMDGQRLLVTSDGAVPLPDVREKLPHTILANGETTGHCHRIKEFHDADLYSTSEGFHLHVRGTAVTVVHEEHAPITLIGGYYRIWRQREYSPEEIRVVRD